MDNKQQADLCLGAEGISEHLGVSIRQARNFITNGDIPVFKLGGRVCALRSKLDAWLLAKSEEANKSDEPDEGYNLRSLL